MDEDNHSCRFPEQDFSHATDGVDIEQISTLSDFRVFLRALRDDWTEYPNHWEQGNIGDYLESMERWLEYLPRYYRSLCRDPDKEPMWRVFAEVLEAAKMYE